jgi:hypothetical protein
MRLLTEGPHVGTLAVSTQAEDSVAATQYLCAYKHIVGATL